MVTGVIVWGLIFYVVVRFRRRSDDEIPRADALQPAARGLLHDRPGHDGASCSSTAPSRSRTRCSTDRRRPRPRPWRCVGQQWSGRSTTASASRTRAPGDRTTSPTAYVYTSGTGADIPTLVLPGRPDHPVQPALARRDPRLRRPVVPHEDGRHPRPGQQASRSPRPSRAPTPASATSSAASTTRGCSSTSRSSARRSTTPTSLDLADAGQHRRASRCSAAPTPATQAGLDDDIGRSTGVSAATAATPQRRGTAAGAQERLGQQVVRIMTTTDHKLIGKMYLDHVVRVVPGRRPDGDADPLRAGLSRASRSSTTSSTTSCSRCTARSCCCCSRRRCSSASPT